VFCSGTQPSLEAIDDAPASLVVEAQGEVLEHAADPTLIGLPTAEVRAALEKEAAAAAAKAAATASSASDATAGARSEAAAEKKAAVAARAFDEQEPWGNLARLVMGLCGAVSLALFFCPWHGVSSWRLIETLAGADFARQLFYLTGGVVLLLTALLPLPFPFRALVGAVVAALPVLLVAAGVLSGGWRGILATVAVLGLPATHMLHARKKTSPTARRLVFAGVAAVVLLYVLPSAHVVPLVAVLRMLFSGFGGAIFAIFILIPLVFAGLSLLGVMGRDFTEVGVLLSVLILVWAPVGVAVRGVMIEDPTQLYVGVGVLWSSATAALSIAQLMFIAAPRQ
jgi:hypothetical protein